MLEEAPGFRRHLVDPRGRNLFVFEPMIVAANDN